MTNLSTSKDPGTPATIVAPELLTKGEAGRLCPVSGRHFRRLVESGAAPLPVRLGRLVRWQKSLLLGWIASGCPAMTEGRDNA